MPSQSHIESICYPELNKLNTEAVRRHGCKHEQDAINTYENAMKKEHVDIYIISIWNASASWMAFWSVVHWKWDA